MRRGRGWCRWENPPTCSSFLSTAFFDRLLLVDTTPTLRIATNQGSFNSNQSAFILDTTFSRDLALTATYTGRKYPPSRICRQAFLSSPILSHHNQQRATHTSSQADLSFLHSFQTSKSHRLRSVQNLQRRTLHGFYSHTTHIR